MSGKLTTLQWKAIYSRICGQHKLDLIGIFKRKKGWYAVGWVEKGNWSGRSWRGGVCEYDHYTLYEYSRNSLENASHCIHLLHRVLWLRMVSHWCTFHSEHLEKHHVCHVWRTKLLGKWPSTCLLQLYHWQRFLLHPQFLTSSPSPQATFNKCWLTTPLKVQISLKQRRKNRTESGQRQGSCSTP